MLPERSLDAANGRWFDILTTIGGIHPDFLQDRHGPCPLCGGQDRFRWDDSDGNGGGYCNQCGGRTQSGGGISGITLLMRARDWSFKNAARAVDQHLGIPSPAAPPAPPPRKPKRPARIPDKPPSDATPPTLDGAIAQWCYRDADGDQLFWIQRVNLPDGKKLFIHRTWIDGQWHRPSKRDAFTSEWPSPRPLYNLHLLNQHPTKPVLLCEGEKAADAAARLFPNILVLSWSNGAKAIPHVDFTPLAGRKVTLWPDADDDGRSCMAKLAPKLLALGVTQVRIIQPPSDVPDGWDLADATDWDTAQARAYVAANRSEPITLPPEPEPEPEPEPTPSAPIERHQASNAPFTCLGTDPDNACFYQVHSTGTVTRITRGSHTTTNLVFLAPLAYWESLYPTKNGVNWAAAASDLFAQQAAIGMFNPDTIRGRGAWWDQGRSILHLGDRLIVDGITQPIRQPVNSEFHYQTGYALKGPGDLTPLTDEEANQIQAIAERFHWEHPASANLVAGWAVLAPISGALSWRPHVWLTAAASSGKSAVLERFVGALLSDIQLPVVGNTSEAFIRQALRSDALPVVMDEAESNEPADQIRIQNVLALARFSSSETRAIIGKGSANGAGGEQRFRIRSMFFLSSISTAVKQGADARRFAQVTLRIPPHLSEEERQSHWQALEADLERIITPETARRLIARTVSLMPVIRQNIRTFTRLAALHFKSQGLGDQYGTLLAGAFSLASSGIATDDDAMALISLCDVSVCTEVMGTPDERRCLDHITQHQLRVDDGGRSQMRTVYELVEIASYSPDALKEAISPAVAEAVLGRHGLRVVDGCLAVSNTATPVAEILSDTPWRNSWPTILGRLPGAKRMGAVRFKGLGVSRAAAIPIEILAV